ncbi:DUF4388 domain-containing protein [Desulfogranum marinum]|uniref:DUF4388 domain-containing protein n=1 Tax=Desulfogranum marinum TaxID=453220 RepID=UPI0029C6C8BF|nr:DUF4388 domain-containing protein [Desulfogranum marinum]
MSDFCAQFKVVEERNCPLYSRDNGFILTRQSVEFLPQKSSCLILIREMTGLLVQLLPSMATGFAEYKDEIFTCGGCTGLIKFQLSESPLLIECTENKVDSRAVMSGKIEAILPAELLQVFHMHQKTGRLIMNFADKAARVTFREGGLLAARFEDLDNHEAVYAILSEKKGDFQFVPGLPESLMQAREIGDFMMILMEGLKRMDEED